MELKKCNKCKNIKGINDFYKNRGSGDGYRSNCKDCQNLMTVKWKKNNPEKTKVISKKYRKNNPQKIKESNKKLAEYYKNYHREYRENNLDKCRNIDKKFREVPRNKLSISISIGICNSLKGNKGGSHWENLVGYTIKDLMEHLEPNFKDGMTWENYGKFSWHIDHKVPISFFEFDSYDSWEFKYCWSLDNLQPLWAKENWVKNNKITN